jgi:hypothetical protein
LTITAQLAVQETMHSLTMSDKSLNEIT